MCPAHRQAAVVGSSRSSRRFSAWVECTAHHSCNALRDTVTSTEIEVAVEQLARIADAAGRPAAKHLRFLLSDEAGYWIAGMDSRIGAARSAWWAYYNVGLAARANAVMLAAAASVAVGDGVQTAAAYCHAAHPPEPFDQVMDGAASGVEVAALETEMQPR